MKKTNRFFELKALRKYMKQKMKNSENENTKKYQSTLLGQIERQKQNAIHDQLRFLFDMVDK